MALKTTSPYLGSKISVSNRQKVDSKYHIFASAGLIAFVFAFSLGIWFYFEHSLPGIDESNHILDSFGCSDLLSHPKFWKGDWWYQLVTVNKFYPPFLYIFNGGLKLAFGPEYWVDIASLIFFGAVGTLSVFGTTYILTRNALAATIAAVTINFYPQLSQISHTPLLDFPMVAMAYLGVFSLVWFNDKPSYLRGLLCGLAMAATCLSKQIAAAFLVGPGAVVMLYAIANDFHNKRFWRTPRLLIAPIVVLLFCVPWYLIGMAATNELAKYNSDNIGHLTITQALVKNFSFYMAGLSHTLSPLLCVTFLLSFAASSIATHKKLLAITASSIGGLLLISCLTWAIPLDRYTPSAFLMPAIYTGIFMANLWNRKLVLLKLLPLVVLGLALVQYISYNFTPYPIRGPEALVNASNAMHMNLRLCQFSNGLQVKDRPTPPADWLQEWSLKYVTGAESPKAPFYLNIMPCTTTINVHTFEYIARKNNMAVVPTTLRVWHVTGDELKFEEKSALYYHWYLLKTGKQGNKMVDHESQVAYEKLTNFVQNSGKFDLRVTRPLPDGSTLMLYRQK